MQNKYGKVAVIMRTKDRKIFLDRAIKSVINQTYSDWILVIVNDGGSLRDIEELLKLYEDKYRRRIKLINNEKSLGMEAASNEGIKAVDSEYVVIHDDDDTWNINFLERTVGYLESKKSCNGVITQSNKVIEKIKGDKIKIKKIKPFNSELKGIISLYDLCLKNLFSPISFIYRRKVLEEIGMYNEELPVLGDWDFNIRFIKRYDIDVIEELLANYHQRPEINKGKYSNSIIGKRNRHIYYEILLQNKFLRDDLENGKFGIGTLINLSRAIKKSNSIYKLREIINKNC